MDKKESPRRADAAQFFDTIDDTPQIDGGIDRHLTGLVEAIAIAQLHVRSLSRVLEGGAA